MHPHTPRLRPRVRGLVAAGAAALLLASLPGAGASLLQQPSAAVEEAFAPRLVTVTADLAGRNLLASSGLDVTEHAGHDYVEVVVHTPADLDLIESFGFPVEVRIPDLIAREAEIREIDRAFAQSVAASELPSGRTSYRSLADYEADLHALAEDHPDIVRLLELPHQSIEGRTVLGVEIASNVRADDGRPAMAIMGLHHAREWPSGENTMEFAVDLVTGHGTDPRITELLDRGRVIVIPVINPDGFNQSYEQGMLVDLREVDGGDTASILATPGNAYKRKNCSTFGIADGAPLACDLPASNGGYGLGVDLNRNYGTFHGGPGADAEPVSPIYHGPEGFSEPETRNVRDLVSSRHVTMLITNHTFGNLVLRPNGVNPATIGPDGLPVGDSPDEGIMAAIGAAMVANNGYANQHGWELYDTTGTTEDWSYNATGGYGYTFEIGPNEFHPPFPEVVDEYLGAGEYAGKGNREAYLVALEVAVDPAHHAVLTGTAVPGAHLELSRSGSMPTWTGSFQDTVATTYDVGPDGVIRWHVNPSTRPIVEGKSYVEPGAEPVTSDSQTIDAPAPNESVDVVWKVTAASDRGVVEMSWPTPDDMDLKVYRVGDDRWQQVGAAETTDNPEVVEIADLQPGTYVLRVTNYASVSPEVTLTTEQYADTRITTTPMVEAWTLSCFVGDRLVEQRAVVIDRGETADLSLQACARP